MGLAALAGCGGDDAPVFRDRDPIEPVEPAVPPSPPGNPPSVLPNGADPGLGANAEVGGAAADGLAGGWAATSENLLGRADVMPTAGNDVRGIVAFERMASGETVAVHVSLEGLAGGQHGFHVHENGDCSGPNAEAAGDHWNPDNSSHGGPDEPAALRHAGDLGNVTANEMGMVDATIETSSLVQNGRFAALGRAIVVHADTDDLRSQPAGMSGDPVACGVIRSMTETSLERAKQDAGPV